MANFNLSANMGLPIPVAGIDPGPDYALNVNSSLTLVDGHTHAFGQGVQITPAGLNLNSDVTFLSNNAIALRSVRFTPQSAVFAGPSDLGCLYEVGVDLYYNDGAGNNVRITQSGGVAGSPGSISNLTSPASAAYVSGNQTFVWQSAANTPANMDGGSFIFRNILANSKGATVNAPTALAANYSLTLPLIPAGNSFLTIDTSGNLSGSILTAAGITGSNIAPSTITLSNLAASLIQYFTPSGVIQAYGAATAPTGWLVCDGASYLRATYPDLFTAIGTSYGSADGTHFNVPNLRGLFQRGWDNGSGNDPDASSRTAANPGGNIGDNIGSYQVDAFRAHTHTMVNGGAGALNAAQLVAGSNGPTSVPSGSTGGNETRPANVYVNYIIKT